MRLNIQLLLLSFIISFATKAQDAPPPTVNLGDSAPPLRVNEWIKGKPIQTFEKGKVYVLEFWATWCKPCIAAMPHLSDLAREYNDKVKVLGIDVFEMKNTSPDKVKAFVKSMGNRMDFAVAAQDSNFMVNDWLEASGERPRYGIPRTFVVNAEGRLAWIGHPIDLDQVLPKIVNNTWNIKQALAKRNLDRYLATMDDSLNFELMRYRDINNPEILGKPDSALLAINEVIRQEPMLKYTPIIASYTFDALLQTNPHKAYEYGKEVLVTPTYDDPAYNRIIEVIEIYSDKLNLPSEIYQLGAEAYQVKIDQIPYPEIVDNIFKYYNKMAEWYWRGNDKSKAIKAEENAIESLKRKKDFSKTDMTAFESRLQQYKTM